MFSTALPFPTGSWVLKPDGVVSWSPEMYQICGFNPQQGPPSYHQIISQIAPADAAEVDQSVRSAVQARKRLGGQCRFIRPDGEVRHLEYLGHAIPGAEGIVEFVGIVRDVTPEQEVRAGRGKYARLLPQHYHSYPPDYRRHWFPVLDRHPDPSVTAQPGYIWVRTPWRLHSMWAEHFEIEERDEP